MAFLRPFFPGLQSGGQDACGAKETSAAVDDQRGGNQQVGNEGVGFGPFEDGVHVTHTGLRDFLGLQSCEDGLPDKKDGRYQNSDDDVLPFPSERHKRRSKPLDGAADTRWHGNDRHLAHNSLPNEQKHVQDQSANHAYYLLPTHSLYLTKSRGAAVVSVLTLTILLGVGAGCATTTGKGRIGGGVLAGGSAGALGGAAFSPNDASRALNALVFGLSGALIGGSIALLFDSGERKSDAPNDLRSRELGGQSPGHEYLVVPQQDLPDFLKRRVQPVVIEEFVEKDRVTEEGTLHEPHRAYRIKRPAELYSSPVPPETGVPARPAGGGKDK